MLRRSSIDEVRRGRRPTGRSPGGRWLEVKERDEAEELWWGGSDGAATRLAEGMRYHGVSGVGSPYDPTAAAWSFVAWAADDP